MKKILVVEDEIALATALTENLTQEGFEVLHAKDGLEGIGLALSSKPDLILLDILIPKMDGLAVLNKLRQDPWGKNVPVMVLSNLNQPANVAAAIDDNVSEYLVKVDWKIEDIVKKIREKLKV